METTDPRFPAHDPKYKDLDPVDLPRSECLSDILKRTMPLWDDDISIKLRSGKRVIVIAHGSNVRVFMKILCQVGSVRYVIMTELTPVLRTSTLRDHLFVDVRVMTESHTTQSYRYVMRSMQCHTCHRDIAHTTVHTLPHDDH